MIYMIGCMNLFHYIGKNNELLYHIPKDLAFFKKKTLNRVIVMGRKTFESLPGLLLIENIGLLVKVVFLILAYELFLLSKNVKQLCSKDTITILLVAEQSIVNF